ncbi:MAG: caspase family protein [Ardenticatenales bacterium]|nr:caspase family protein [Ardenticatenales bacterium]
MDLKAGLASGNGAAFVCAGLSVDAGLPSWYSLIAELATRAQIDVAPEQWVTGEALVDAAQAYINKRGLHSLIAYVKEQFDTIGIAPTEAHRALARLPIGTVFTTNIDNLLELAYREAGMRVRVVVRDQEIPFAGADSDCVTIVKLRGNLDQPDTLVLARQQFDELYLQRPQMFKLLETELGRRDMLYLGMSQADPYFNRIVGEVMSQLGPFMRTGYALLCEATEARRLELARSHIQIVEFGADGDCSQRMAAWLNELAPLEPARPAPVIPPPVSQYVLNSGHSWAVLVGINDYHDPNIPNLRAAVGDVVALGQVLSGHYDAVRVLTDATLGREPTRANILAELASLAQVAAADDLILLHFSGHGVEEHGESFLVPSDARLPALSDTAIGMAHIRTVMERSPARAKVIILDACHAGAAIGSGRDAGTMTVDFIRRVFEQAEGMAVLASCKQGQKSWERTDTGHGVFSEFLLEALGGRADFDQKGFVTVSDASRYVTDGVRRWSVENGAPQTPTLQYTVAGDIVLIRL